MVPIAHEQNIICSKTRLDGTTHEQTIICRQLFAGHVMDSRPIEREEKKHGMMNLLIDLLRTVIAFMYVTHHGHMQIRYFVRKSPSYTPMA